MRFLLLACSLCVTLWKVYGDCDGGDVDGCTNFYLYDTYEAIFTPACNRHDVCYGCGAKFNYDQSKCDRIFYNRLLAACRSNYASGTNNREKCEEHAGKYKTAVDALGRWSYNDEDELGYYCSQSWVPPCL